MASIFSNLTFPRFRHNAASGLVAVVAISVAIQGGTLKAAPGDDAVSDAQESKEAVATLAGGCFWCTEAVFERMEGVNDVVSGYIGGHIRNPSYEQVLTKRSGHAEAVEISEYGAPLTDEARERLFFF